MGIFVFRGGCQYLFQTTSFKVTLMAFISFRMTLGTIQNDYFDYVRHVWGILVSALNFFEKSQPSKSSVSKSWRAMRLQLSYTLTASIETLRFWAEKGSNCLYKVTIGQKCNLKKYIPVVGWFRICLKHFSHNQNNHSGWLESFGCL